MSTAVEQKAHYCRRLYIQVYADDEPQDKAEKMYQICGDIEELSEVAEFLKEYCDIPSADRPTGDIVYCKDCVYCTVQNTKYIYAICQRHGIEFKPFEDDTRTHFCAWGERMSND